MTPKQKLIQKLQEFVWEKDLWILEKTAEETESGCPKFIRVNRDLNDKIPNLVDEVIGIVVDLVNTVEVKGNFTKENEEKAELLNQKLMPSVKKAIISSLTQDITNNNKE